MLKKLDIGASEIEQVEAFNALVDAVNEIMTWRFETDDESPAENVQDKFAEQRKWIGKLCWYKLCEGDTWKVGRLEKIQENADAGYPFVFDGLCYEICEPVKPDDDIIYKGEQ